MSAREPDNFFKAVLISATVHFTAAALVLSSLAPVPAVLLPGNKQDIISVSLVRFSSGTRKEKDSGVSRSAVLKVDNSGPISQPEEGNIAKEEAKNGAEPSDAALDVYAKEHFHAGTIRGSVEKMTGQNSGGVTNSVNVNASAEGLITPHLIPSYRRNNPPRYPVAARLKCQEGLVLVATEVMADGTVGN